MRCTLCSERLGSVRKWLQVHVTLLGLQERRQSVGV